VSSDLLFRSRVDAAARDAGLALRVARTPEQLERHLAGGLDPSLAVVDLECDTLDPPAAIARLRAMPWGPDLRVVGYAGHTNASAIQAGRAAGASTVLARSAFVAQLPALLAGVAEGERGRSTP
jgi:CheY-like chemotaxis protein